MRFGFLLLLGLVFAAGLGFAAHLIARDTVALPVASIEAGEGLAPIQTRAVTTARRTTSTARTTSTGATTTRAATTRTTTTETETDDDSGRGRGRNRGSGGGDDSDD
jgi:hypothetical protein